MTEETNAGEKLDKLLAALDGMTTRLDALEKRQAAADKQRRADARKRKDSAAEASGVVPKTAGDPDDPDRKIDEPKRLAADDEGNESMGLPDEIRRAKALREELNKAERRISAAMREQGPLCEAEEAEMADAQARADSAYAALGKRAPAPLPGERLQAYRARLLKPLARYSEVWQHVNIADHRGANLDKIEKDIIADAQAYADSGAHLADGELVPHIKVDPNTGLRTTTFVGRGSFVRNFKRPAQYARIVDPREIKLREMLIREGL